MLTTANIHEVRSAASEDTIPSGPEFPLGTVITFGAQSGDRILAYVNAGDGAATDGDVLGDQDYDSLSTLDETIVHEKDTGEMEWLYIKAGSAIRRGEPIVGQTSANVVSPFVGVPSLAGDDNRADKVIGVAQFNIPSGSFAFILKSGVGVVATDGGVVDGDGLVPDGTAGQADTISAATSPSFAVALTDDGDTASGYADVNSKTLVKAMVAC